MAKNNPSKETLTTAVDVIRSSGDPEPLTGVEDEEEEVGEEELKKLEMEAEEMTKKILEYRATLPDQLKTTLTSILSSQRPNLSDFNSGLDPGLSRASTANLGEEGTSIRDQKNAEKLKLLKDKFSSNVAAMPIVIDRVKECLSKIDNVDSYNGVIHPVFKKKKTS